MQTGWIQAAPPGLFRRLGKRPWLFDEQIRTRSCISERTRNVVWFLLYSSGKRDVLWAFGKAGLKCRRESSEELEL